MHAPLNFCDIIPLVHVEPCHGHTRVHIEPCDFCEFDDDTYIPLCAHYMDDYVLVLFEQKSLEKLSLEPYEAHGLRVNKLIYELVMCSFKFEWIIIQHA